MSPSFCTLNPEPMRFVTGTEIPMARTGPCHLSTDPPSTCRKFLDLKLTNEGITADVCGNPLQMQQPCCGERSPGFPEIRVRCPSYLMCQSLGMIQSLREYSAKGGPRGKECETSLSGIPIAH